MSMENLAPAILTPELTLADLPSIDSSIDYAAPGEEVLDLFNRNPADPGVVLLKDGAIYGLISRDAFFENTGKRFGVEIFLNRPIYLMLENQRQAPLILPDNERISQAIHAALKRNPGNIYDPIILRKPDQTYRIIDILTVFMAENRILLSLHNQHLFTVTSGMAMSDQEAVYRFSLFTGLPEEGLEKILIRKNTVTCEICRATLTYSIADVVRSYPQINRGVEVVSKMGNTTYVLYVRHTCGETIREIPVQYDAEFNIRALRPSRLVETYVQSII